MFGVLASCLLLLALGLPGTAALRRLTDRLTTLELWAYGLPLGVVVGSLLILLLGVLFGALRLPLVLVVAVGSLVVAAALGPWRATSAALGETLGREQRLGFAAGAATTGKATSKGKGKGKATVATPSLPERPSLPDRLLTTFGPLSLCILGLFIIRWALLWRGALTYEATGLFAGQVNIWGDWALHLGDVTAFVYGDNLPPQNTRWAGTPYAYHYLTSITAAAMVRLGLDPAMALSLQSFLFCLLMLVGLFAFAVRLTRDRNAAGVSVALFLLGGTLGWLVVANAVNQSHDLLGTLLRQPWDNGQQSDLNFRWPNLFFALIESQRGYLYGLPLFLLILTLLYEGVQGGGKKLFAAAGVIAGTLPFAHTSTLAALALITPFVALLFIQPLREWVINWTLFFGLWIAIAVPQLLLQQGGQNVGTQGLRWQIGWVAAPDSWPWFWLKNLGWFIPLLLIALASRTLLTGPVRRFLWAMMPIFAICNLVAFFPWDWDNTKFFFYWFLAVTILVAALLVRTWREHSSLVVRALVLSVVATMTLSGLLLNFQQLIGKDHNLFLSTEELAVAAQVRDLTPPHAVFATGLQHNHPVTVMAGRAVMMGYPGWLFSYGIDYSQRERDLRAIYALAANTPALLEKYNVEYVVIGPNERQNLKPNVEAFRSRYQRIINTGNYEVFKVR